jgi:hypothetical protein
LDVREDGNHQQRLFGRVEVVDKKVAVAVPAIEIGRVRGCGSVTLWRTQVDNKAVTPRRGFVIDAFFAT